MSPDEQKQARGFQATLMESVSDLRDQKMTPELGTKIARRMVTLLMLFEQLLEHTDETFTNPSNLTLQAGQAFARYLYTRQACARPVARSNSREIAWAFLRPTKS